MSNTKRILWRCVIFAGLGLLFEVFWGVGWCVKHGRWTLVGRTSFWMIFDYGLFGVLLLPIATPLIRRGVPLCIRALVYMLLIFAVELVSGWILDMCGIKVWDYSKLPWNFRGYISAAYIPVWYALGLVAEYLHRKVDAAAVVLTLGLTADQLAPLAHSGEACGDAMDTTGRI